MATIDGGELGRTPIEAHDLAPGRHRARVDFEGGGSSEKVVFVRAGETAVTRVEQSQARKVARFRQGVRFGAQLGFLGPLDNQAGTRFGASIGGFLNIGLSPALEARFGLTADPLPANLGGFWMPIALPISLRFNLGSIYTMSLGVKIGELLSGGFDAATGLFFGPSWSVFGLRLGPHREVEINLDQSVLDFPAFEPLLSYSQSLTVAYVFGTH